MVLGISSTVDPNYNREKDTRFSELAPDANAAEKSAFRTMEGIIAQLGTKRPYSCRAFRSIPMFISFWWILTVRGHLFPRILGFMYFVSWLIIEILLTYAEFRPLNQTEIRHAESIIKHYVPSSMNGRERTWLDAARISTILIQNFINMLLIAAFGSRGWQYVSKWNPFLPLFQAVSVYFMIMGLTVRIYSAVRGIQD